jgi:hypothetical protein
MTNEEEKPQQKPRRPRHPNISADYDGNLQPKDHLTNHKEKKPPEDRSSITERLDKAHAGYCQAKDMVKQMSDHFDKAEAQGLILQNEVNKNKLDDEVCRCPAMFDFWSSIEALVIGARDQVKSRLDTIQALVELSIKSMEKSEIESIFGVKNPTVDTIKSLISTDERVLAWGSLHLQASIMAREASLRRQSWVERNRSLEILQRLFSSEYWYREARSRESADTEAKQNREMLKRKIRENT